MISIGELIDNQSVLNPNKVAIKHGEKTFTYKEVSEISDRLASFFRSKNINVGDVVGLAIDRSPEMLISLLALRKAGATYLPIDNGFPVERIDYMLTDSSVKLLITSKRFEEQYRHFQNTIFIEDVWAESALCDIQNPPDDAEKNTIAYILYTSGSTGKPKGVKVRRLGVVNFLLSMQKSPGMSPGDVMLATTTISFDIAQLEIFLPLISGAMVVIANAETVRDGRALLDMAKSEKITIMQGTPFMWRTMLEADWTEKLPLKILCGGESLPKDLAEKLLARCTSLWNMYGPTETTIWSTIKKISADDKIITIGRPIDNTQVYILDGTLNEVNNGLVGEICIGGDGVAEGYLNRPDLTAEKFINDKFGPVSEKKIYRTGDFGKVLDNGEIQCLGRIDHQIKIRGYRIEAEEIEYQLKRQQNVKDALITVYTDARNNVHLVAYIVPVTPVPKAGNNELVKAWKTGLERSLPSYMIPNTYMVINAIPLNSNGKTDRRALPGPVINQLIADGYEAPQTETEAALLKICLKSIDVNKIGVNDNFFELGLDSLVGVSIMVQVEKQFGKRLPLSTLIKHDTIRKLASFIDDGTDNPVFKSLVPIKPGGSKVPLYIIHGIGLNILNLYNMVSNLDSDQPVYGLQAIGLDGTVEMPEKMEDIAHFYVEEIIKHDPVGPYAIAGYSFGGYIAFEMVKQLKEMGKDVKLLAMFDTNVQIPTHQYPLLRKIIVKTIRQFKKAAFRIGTIVTQSIETLKFLKANYLIEIKLFLKRIGLLKNYHPQNLPDFMEAIAGDLNAAYYNYTIKPYHVKIDLFKAEKRLYFVDDPKFLGWGKYALDGIEVYNVPGDHKDMFDVDKASIFAKILQRRLDQIK